MTKPAVQEAPTRWTTRTASAISIWWSSHGIAVLRLACVVMALFAALKLGDEFRRLLFDTGYNGAIDTRILNELVRGWFEGRPLYQELVPAIHPPATYVLLWPLLGWLQFAPARWLWAITSVAAMGWLVFLIVQQSGARTRLECLFVALLLLSMNSTGVAIGNGQLILHILPILLAALLLLRRNRAAQAAQLAAAAMLLWTLVKPTISAPFLWMALFSGGGLLITVLVGLGYAGLTLFALLYQESTPYVLARAWNDRVTVAAATGGYANLHKWLASFGLEDWILLVSLLIFVALGWWIYRHRKGDFWILLGVTALVARFWTFHRVYDDVLILLPMVTLFRLTKRNDSPEGTGIVAGALLGVTAVAMLAPARLEHFPWPWSLAFTGGHALLWLVVLGFLIAQAHYDRKAEV